VDLSFGVASKYHEVTARSSALSGVPVSPEQNCEDLIAAQTVIIFTEKPNTILATGGYNVEFGLALAQNKGVIVVGPPEKVFHYLLPDFRCSPLGMTHRENKAVRPASDKVRSPYP
jgi:hypothetical protein